jgi:hypothetical protein
MKMKNKTVLPFLLLLPSWPPHRLLVSSYVEAPGPFEEILPPIEPVPPFKAVNCPPQEPSITKDAANKPHKRGSLFAKVSLGFPEWRSLPFQIEFGLKKGGKTERCCRFGDACCNT